MRAGGTNYHQCLRLILISSITLNIIIILKLNFSDWRSCPPQTEETKELMIAKVLEENDKPLWAMDLNFEELNFSNITGNPDGCYVVPNIVHFVRLGEKPITYVEMICILAAFKNQKPDKILFHRDHNNPYFGRYWEILKNTKGFMDIVEFNYVLLPTEIFGRSLSTGWKYWHGGDIVRIRMLIKYGGIYVDNDSYLVKSLDNFRRYEIALNWDENQYLASQLVVAHKDARFLKEWLNTYKDYRSDRWYYNAGERPTTEVLYKRPELIHRVKVLFGADNKYIHNLFQQQWPEWKNFYALHLLYRHQYLLHNISNKATFPVELDENNIGDYPITFREMAYDVYNIAGITWPKRT